jgi:hypothetical protein
VRGNNTQFARILAGSCAEQVSTYIIRHLADVYPSFYPCHETTSNRGWLCNQKEPEVLLIDFNKSSLLMVYKALCLLEPTTTGQTDVHIKGSCMGERGRWIRDTTLELRE